MHRDGGLRCIDFTLFRPLFRGEAKGVNINAKNICAALVRQDVGMVCGRGEYFGAMAICPQRLRALEAVPHLLECLHDIKNRKCRE